MSHDPERCRVRDEVLLDHLVNLVEQVRLLAETCRQDGIDVPAQVGTLGPADNEVMERLMRESIARNKPGYIKTWENYVRDHEYPGVVSNPDPDPGMTRGEYDTIP